MNRYLLSLLFFIIIVLVLLVWKNRRRTLSTKIDLTLPQEKTYVAMFRRIAATMGATKAMMVRRRGEWKAITYQRYRDYVQVFGVGLMMWGLKPKDRVGIIGYNAPGWFIAHTATLAAGGVSVGIYPTNTPEACGYIMDHSRIKVLVVENQKQLDKFLQDGPLEKRFPRLKLVISYSEEINEKIKNEHETSIISWQHLFSLVQTHLEPTRIEKLNKRSDMLKPEDPATFIYTSGTTGNPKAVVITHNNIMESIRGIFHKFMNQGSSQIGLEQGQERIISYLPLSHIAAQMFDIYLSVSIAGTVYFSDPLAFKGTLPQTLKEVKPTLFIGVPRVWEKMAEKIQAKMSNLTGWRWFLSESLKYLAPNLRNTKILSQIGLEECKYQVTAAAPISPSARDFFTKIDFRLYDLYGMSETTGLITISLADSFRAGSIGKPLPGLTVKISPDGEIMVKGEMVFHKYFEEPEKTLETFDEDGWLLTGDLGRIDQDGFIYITGRSKELIITAGGENVSPVPIEERIKVYLPFVADAIVIGDQRKFLSVLLTLRTTVDSDGEPTQQLESEIAELLQARTTGDAIDSVILEEQIKTLMDRVNQESVSNAQKIRKWLVVPDGFSVSRGDLTPTMKLKRKSIYQKYQSEIDQLYL